MVRLIARRVALSRLTLSPVSLLVATALLKRDATPAALAAPRARLALERPALERYRAWLAGGAREKPVVELVAPRVRNTLVLSRQSTVDCEAAGRRELTVDCRL